MTFFWRGNTCCRQLLNEALALHLKPAAFYRVLSCCTDCLHTWLESLPDVAWLIWSHSNYDAYCTHLQLTCGFLFFYIQTQIACSWPGLTGVNGLNGSISLGGSDAVCFLLFGWTHPLRLKPHKIHRGRQHLNKNVSGCLNMYGYHFCLLRNI